MSLQTATADINTLADLLAAMATECKKEQEEEEREEAQRRRGRGFPDFTAPLGDLFGVAIWAEGFGVVGDRYTNGREFTEWGGATGLGGGR